MVSRELGQLVAIRQLTLGRLLVSVFKDVFVAWLQAARAVVLPAAIALFLINCRRFIRSFPLNFVAITLPDFEARFEPWFIFFNSMLI